jgi:tripartite-type tricarboxylate transporter receptor subunit TctC
LPQILRKRSTVLPLLSSNGRAGRDCLFSGREHEPPVRTLKEFVAHAKSDSGKLSYGSAGVGSASHLAAELLKHMGGFDMTHVPNKGMNPALIVLMANQVQVLFASVPGMLSEKSNRIRPIAMAELKRSALMPDMPTMDESGLRGFAVNNWAGLLGPARIDYAIVAILDTPEMKERVKTLGSACL